MALRDGMSGAKRWDVISAGDAFIDLVMTGFPSLPQLGEEGFCTGCTRETGGGAAHTSSGLAKLGMKSALYCVAGADEIEWFKRKFADRGVDTSLVVAHPDQATAITVAVSTPQDRIFYTCYGANALLAELLRKTSTWELFTEARHVHFAYPVEAHLLTEMSQWLRSRGTGVSFDLGWHENWLADPASVAAVGALDWFLPNDREAERMTGESDPARMIEWFRDHGARGVAVKLGPNGSMAFHGSEVRQAPSIAVNPIDTTGAGDCFNAGFLYGMLSGFTLQESLRYGNICGALSTEATGGIAGFPTLERVRQAR
jgi:ribokinase